MDASSLKTDCTRVAFGDVVRLSRERAPDPEADGFTRYIGLEHINPGDLTIRRWGNVAEGTTFTNVFRPGQVLFGKRRAYLQKVAAPGFSGVCSSDIYVLESKDDRHLLPDLLPFICQTDAFFKHAVGTSAGSLSPRTNWQALATYEFALPPLKDQRRQVDVLLAVDTTTEAFRTLVEALRRVESSTFDALVARSRSRNVLLGELLVESPRNGCSAVEASHPTGHWVLTLDALINTKSGYQPGRIKQVQPTAAMQAAALSSGDLLISRSNTRELVGLAGTFDEGRRDVSWPDTMMRLRPDTAVPQNVKSGRLGPSNSGRMIASINHSLDRRSKPWPIITQSSPSFSDSYRDMSSRPPPASTGTVRDCAP